MDVTTAPTLAHARINNTTALSDGAMPPPPSAWAATETAPEVPPTKAPRSCATSFGPGVIRERIQAATTRTSSRARPSRFDAVDGSQVAPLTFLQSLYTNGARSSFNAVGHHPYSYPALPTDEHDWNSWSQMSVESFAGGGIVRPSLRGIMTANGDSAKKIWITEFGAPTSGTPDSVSEARQLEIYQAAMADKQTKSWLGPLIFYRLNDYAPYGATTDRESYFGAVRSDGTVKPSGAYVKSVLCP